MSPMYLDFTEDASIAYGPRGLVFKLRSRAVDGAAEEVGQGGPVRLLVKSD
jgi:hypothetical protein